MLPLQVTVGCTDGINPVRLAQAITKSYTHNGHPVRAEVSQGLTTHGVPAGLILIQEVAE